MEILERIFFIEGAILASDQFLTPFGAQPADISNATQNRYIAANYRVSPYIKGTTSDGIRYELRNNNTWTNLERYADRDQQCVLQRMARQCRESRPSRSAGRSTTTGTMSSSTTSPDRSAS